MKGLVESKPAMPLERYLIYRYGRLYGSRKAFARDMGVGVGQVKYWLSEGWVVIGDRLYAPRRLVK